MYGRKDWSLPQEDLDRRDNNLISDIIQVIKKKPGRVFGLSFKEDGKLGWQFFIRSHDGLLFEITTYSWLTGLPYTDQTVTSRFICDECAIFFSHEEFLERAEALQRAENSRIEEAS